MFYQYGLPAELPSTPSVSVSISGAASATSAGSTFFPYIPVVPGWASVTFQSEATRSSLTRNYLSSTTGLASILSTAFFSNNISWLAAENSSVLITETGVAITVTGQTGNMAVSIPGAASATSAGTVSASSSAGTSVAITGAASATSAGTDVANVAPLFLVRRRRLPQAPYPFLVPRT